jgi:hypothetical protein
MYWFACQPGDQGINAVNEIMEYQGELNEEAELDGEDDQAGGSDEAEKKIG